MNDTLVQKESEFEAILNSTGEGIYVINPEEKLVFVNRAAVEMLGWSAAELDGQLTDALIHHTRADGTPYPFAGSALYQALREGTVQRRDDEVFWRKDGSWFPVSYSSTPVHQDNQIVGAVCVFRDVTAERQIQDEVRSLQARALEILEGMSDGFVALDAQLNYTYVNARGAELIGHARQDLIGKNFRTEFREARDTPFAEACARVLETRAPMIFEEHDAPSDRWFENRIYPSREGIVIFVSEITERKRAERRVRHLTRLYTTLNQVNQTIVRAHDRAELFRSVCTVAVEEGKFGLAWIGMVEQASGAVTPVAVHGTAHQHLPFESINFKEMPFRDGLIGQGVRTGGIVYSRDIQTDPTMQHSQHVSRQGNYHAAAAVPFA